jgi:hypothetical protein
MYQKIVLMMDHMTNNSADEKIAELCIFVLSKVWKKGYVCFCVVST